MKRLFQKKNIAEKNATDSVKKRWAVYGRKRNPALLERFYTAWMNLSKFREDRDRSLRYVYGDQWSDTILYKGRLITEKNYIQSKGNIPLVNNVMRSLVNSVTGIYAKQDTEPVCYARNRNNQLVGNMMTATLQCNWQTNKMQELLLSIFEEFLVSGVASARETYEFREDVLDEYTDAVNPYYMAWEGGSDPRHTDIRMIGQLHDMDFNDLVSTFAGRKTGITVQELKDLYFGSGSERAYEDFQSASYLGLNEKNGIGNVSFYNPANRNEYRVYEIWTKEIKERIRCWDVNSGERYKIELSQMREVEQENRARMELGAQYGMNPEDIPLIETERFIDNYWYYSFLTPSGHVLLEGETPYEFKSHPYTIKLYPFINGEVHSFTSTFIDQQRYINRLITLNDFILRTSAKGVTLVPEDCIPDDMSPEEFAERWTSVDGIIIYKPKPGSTVRPEVFHNNSTNIGINEMLQLQLSLVDRISNVTGALQGKTPTSGTSAARYSMETQNATTSLAAILKKFSTFTEDIAKKKVKIMQQYYEDGRFIGTGSKSSDITQYDAVSARDVEFVMAIRESAASPVYRMMMNDWLKELWAGSNGLITVQDLLRYGDFPFADKLLQDIEERQQKVQQGEMPGEILTENMAQQIGADPQRVQSADNLLRRA